MPRRNPRRNPIPPADEEAGVEMANAPALAAPNDAVPVEDFGRDKDLKALVWSLQSKVFTGKGADISKVLEK